METCLNAVVGTNFEFCATRISLTDTSLHGNNSAVCRSEIPFTVYCYNSMLFCISSMKFANV